MNLKTAHILLCIVATLINSGCNKRSDPITLEGQVYLADPTREATKLSMVEILLVESNSAVNAVYLQQEAEARLNQLTTEYRHAKQTIIDLRSYVLGYPIAKESAIAEKRTVLERRERIQQIFQLTDWNDYSPETKQSIVNQLEASEKELAELEGNLAESNSKFEHARRQWQTATGKFDTIRKEVGDLLPKLTLLGAEKLKIINRTMTDADGNFRLSAFPNTNYYVVAQCIRKLASGDENYWWAVRLTNTSTRVFLNNENLLSCFVGERQQLMQAAKPIQP